MQPALEDPTQQRAVEAQSFSPVHLAEPGLGECRPPLGGRPVRIAKWYAMANIAHPVHQSQPFVAQPCPGEVILDDHLAGRDSRRLPYQQQRIVGVVQDVNQHHQIVRTVGERKNPPIELLNGYRRPRTCAYLYPRRSKARSPVDDRTRKRAVTTSDVQKRFDAGRDHLRDVIGESPDTASEDQSAVQSRGDA